MAEKRNNLGPVPEPVVIKNTCPVKGLKLLSDDCLLLAGLESGDVQIIEKDTFKILHTQKISEFPVLKIDQTLQAILIQTKDAKGSVYVCTPPNYSKGKYKMEVVFMLETLSSGFTTFTSVALMGYDEALHIAVIAPDPEMAHMPKIFLLAEDCKSVIFEESFNALPSAGKGKQNEGAAFANKTAKGKNMPKDESERPIEGAITCLKIVEWNIDPELFLGYESGAIGMLKLAIEPPVSDDVKRVGITKLFSGQKLI